MKKPKQINTKIVERIEKDVDKVNVIHEKIKKLQKQLDKIEKDYNWVRYMGSKDDIILTENERIKFYKLTQRLIYTKEYKKQ